MAPRTKCNAEESETYSQAKCDSCDELLCINCSNLSASEQKGVTVKKRSPCITFLCKKCTKGKSEKQEIGPEIKTMIGKLLQKGFDEIKSAFLKNDKLDGILKNVQSNNEMLTKLKRDHCAVLDKIDLMAVNHSNLIETNKEVIGMCTNSLNSGAAKATVNAASQESAFESVNMKQIKEDQEKLRHRCEVLEAQVLILKEEIGRLTTTRSVSARHLHAPNTPNNSTTAKSPSVKNSSVVKTSNNINPDLVVNPPVLNKNKKVTISAATLTPRASVFVK